MERKNLEGKLLIKNDSDIFNFSEINDKTIKIDDGIYSGTFILLINNKIKYSNKNYIICIFLKIFNEEEKIDLIFNFKESVNNKIINNKIVHTTDYPIFIFSSINKGNHFNKLNENDNICLYGYSWVNPFEYYYNYCQIDYDYNKISTSSGGLYEINYLSDNGEFKIFEDSHLEKSFGEFNTSFLYFINRRYYYPAFFTVDKNQLFPLVQIKNEDIKFFENLSIDQRFPSTKFGKIAKILFNSRTSYFISSLKSIIGYFNDNQKKTIENNLNIIKKGKNENKIKINKLYILNELFELFNEKYISIKKSDYKIFLNNVTEEDIIEKQKEI